MRAPRLVALAKNVASGRCGPAADRSPWTACLTGVGRPSARHSVHCPTFLPAKSHSPAPDSLPGRTPRQMRTWGALVAAHPAPAPAPLGAVTMPCLPGSVTTPLSSRLRSTRKLLRARVGEAPLGPCFSPIYPLPSYRPTPAARRSHMFLIRGYSDQSIRFRRSPKPQAHSAVGSILSVTFHFASPECVSVTRA